MQKSHQAKTIKIDYIMPLKPIVLVGEQKRVLFLPVTEPIQIKGVAGSGKTTVALYRAKHLIDTQSNLFEEAKVALFTFNKSLVNYIKAIMPYISSGYQKDSDEIKPLKAIGLKIKITNFDKWAYDFIETNGIKLNGKILEPKAQKILIDSSINNLKLQSNKFSNKHDFLLEEILWIKGKLLLDKESYLNAKRVGRGTADRITKNDKDVIWSIFKEYERLRLSYQTYDFSDFALLCLKLIDTKSDFSPPYTHLIIDEAQDLSKAEMLVLSKIVSQSTRSISIIADAAQRIYKSGFTWSEVGINVVGGRTSAFKKNYRNTEAITKAAISLLENEPDKSDFTQIEPARKGGKKPIVGYFQNWNEQSNFLLDQLSKLKLIGQISSTVILHRNHIGIRNIKRFLESNKIQVQELLNTSEIDFNSDSIKLCTLSSIKGLEFDNVFLIDLNDDVIPYPQGFNDADDDFHVSTERRLLYTSMTRARERLFLLSSGTPTRYLSEIDVDLLEKVGNTNSARIVSNDDLPF